MHPLIRRTWPILALLAGLLLIYFELRTAHGITADNAFWLFIAVFIVILAAIDLIQKRPDKKD
jgi:membrane-bound metal-dependent hydrolase YbcI (DUF457 family)